MVSKATIIQTFLTDFANIFPSICCKTIRSTRCRIRRVAMRVHAEVVSGKLRIWKYPNTSGRGLRWFLGNKSYRWSMVSCLVPVTLSPVGLCRRWDRFFISQTKGPDTFRPGSRDRKRITEAKYWGLELGIVVCWPLRELLGKITRVFASLCSHAHILVKMCSTARNFINPAL